MMKTSWGERGEVRERERKRERGGEREGERERERERERETDRQTERQRRYLSLHIAQESKWLSSDGREYTETRLVRTPKGNEKEYVLNKVRSIASAMVVIGKANVINECTY